MKATVRTSNKATNTGKPKWFPNIGDFCFYTPSKLKTTSSRRTTTLPKNALVHRIDVSSTENRANIVKFAYVEGGMTVKLTKATAEKAVASGRISEPTAKDKIEISFS